MHFGLQKTHVIGCFLGANVAVYYRSVRVRLGDESWVIALNGAHRARTVHPFPLCVGGTQPKPPTQCHDTPLLDFPPVSKPSQFSYLVHSLAATKGLRQS